MSISSLGVFDKECLSFIDMLNTLGMDKKHQQYCITVGRLYQWPLDQLVIFFAAGTGIGLGLVNISCMYL